MGNRIVITPGAAATAVDMQRLADVACTAEDRVSDTLFTPAWAGDGVFDKKVFPLVPEPGLSPYVRPRLVYPGTITGGVDILPAFYEVGAPGAVSASANTIRQSASKQTLYSLPATAFPSSVGPRIDLVYAKVELVDTAESRKYKDPNTGAVTTSPVTLYSTPTVTFGVVTGADDGSLTVGDVPADTASAWHFPLAFLFLDNGSGGAWTQGTAIAQTRINQFWDSGWIRRHRVQLAESASIMSDLFDPAVNGRASTPLSNRWGASISVSAILQVKVDGTGVFKVLDNAHDWSRRFAKIYAGYLADSIGNAATPDGSSPAPARFDPTTNVLSTFQFIGATAGSRYLLQDWHVGSAEHLKFYLSTTGALEVEFVGGPLGGGGSSVYVILIEASDQFLL